MLSDASDAVSQAVRWIINLAPFGILGLVFNAVSTSGIQIFTQYGKLILLLVGCMLFQEFITNGIIVGFCLKKNPLSVNFPLCKRKWINSILYKKFCSKHSCKYGTLRKNGLR